jgi:pilus assembly protein Flp/PilA
MIRSIRKAKNEEGASAVEYGLLVAAIAAVIVIIIFALGGVIKNVFEKTCTSIQTGASTSSACTS